MRKTSKDVVVRRSWPEKCREEQMLTTSSVRDQWKIRWLMSRWRRVAFLPGNRLESNEDRHCQTMDEVRGYTNFLAVVRNQISAADTDCIAACPRMTVCLVVWPQTDFRQPGLTARVLNLKLFARHSRFCKFIWATTGGNNPSTGSKRECI